jgi:Phosphoesterase family
MASVSRVVVFVQENHTTDNYFRGLAPYGARVASRWPISPNPPKHDQPHDRRAYFRWLETRQAVRVQFRTRAVLPYYLYLATTGAFFENHCSRFGTGSTPNHLVLIGGQSPTLRNPPRGTSPHWDMPSIFGLAEEQGVTWRAYTGRGRGYPTRLYTQLRGSPNVVATRRFVADAVGGDLPTLCYVWHATPENEHPPQDVTKGMDAVWRAVDAVVRGGGWQDTVFMLTYDDWGGYDDHAWTPATEYTPDNVQLAFGPRVPLIMFGGRVRPGIDHRWCSQTSVLKTVLQLLGMPALGVARADDDPGLVDRVEPTATTAPPPPHGTPIRIPPAPSPHRRPTPPPPPPVSAPVPVPPVVLRDGSTLPPPHDVKLPNQPHPPSAGPSRTRAGPAEPGQG